MNSNFCINNDILLRNMIYGFRRMIYLLRKHDIISVHSYAAGIYHPPKVDIISKIYHPFRKERISLKNDKFLSKLVVFHGRSSGTRTRGLLVPNQARYQTALYPGKSLPPCGKPQRGNTVVARLGFEPRQTESESVVLPLHNSAVISL